MGYHILVFDELFPQYRCAVDGRPSTEEVGHGFTAHYPHQLSENLALQNVVSMLLSEYRPTERPDKIDE